MDEHGITEDLDWSKYLHKSTRMFFEKDLELDYVRHTSKMSLHIVKRALTLQTRFMSFWTAYVTMKYIFGVGGVVDVPAFQVVICTLLTSVGFACKCFVSSNASWCLKDDNLESMLGTVLAVVFIGLPFLFAEETYSSPYDECFWENVPANRTETYACPSEIVTEYWTRFMLISAIFPFLIVFYMLWLRVIRFRVYFRVTVPALISHAVRSLLITPVPQKSVVVWTFLLYILIPLMSVSLMRNFETERRMLFLVQLHLGKDKETLARKLKAAEKAMAFEAPTWHEKEVVQSVVEKVGPGLKDVEVLFDQLVLYERVGAGSFCEVIRGDYGKTTVAVKRLLRTHINTKMTTMVLKEVALLRGLRHPNIVQLVGASWDSVANVCLVLEYVVNGSLQGILDDMKIELSWMDPLLKMMMDIVCGMVYLHSRRPTPIIHRDLKPDNVLVTPTFGCKVTDFGSSRSSANETMTQVGTQSYMAPEVMRGLRYDEKVDVYSLGLVLVAMHTRQPPFAGLEPGTSVVWAVLNEKRPEIPVDMPRPLVNLARRCWEDDPAARPTCEEVLKTMKSSEKEVIYNSSTAIRSFHAEDDDDEMLLSTIEVLRPNK